MMGEAGGAQPRARELATVAGTVAGTQPSERGLLPPSAACCCPRCWPDMLSKRHWSFPSHPRQPPPPTHLLPELHVAVEHAKVELLLKGEHAPPHLLVVQQLVEHLALPKPQLRGGVWRRPACGPTCCYLHAQPTPEGRENTREQGGDQHRYAQVPASMCPCACMHAYLCTYVCARACVHPARPPARTLLKMDA